MTTSVRGIRYRKNCHCCCIPDPVAVPFQAGASAEVDEGEFLEISGGNFIPLATDKAMAATVAISLSEVASGDLAGYRLVHVPHPGDVFEGTLLSTDAQNPARGTALYISNSETLTTTAGTNIIGHVYGHDGFPRVQGRQSQDASLDAGTTVGNCAGGKILFTIKESASYYNALQGDDVA